MNDPWYKEEDEFQDGFKSDDLKPYKPFIVIRISVWRGRNISVGYISDMLDTPDPQLRLSCNSEFNTKVFKTHIQRNDVNPDWNDEFVFVVGKEVKLTGSNKWVKIKIDLIDVDQYRFDDFLGSKELDFTDLELGAAKDMTLEYDGHGEVDITVKMELRTHPDLRVSNALCEQERIYRKIRKPKTMEALQKLLGDDGPRNLSETPTISIATSGGGYRAMVACTGFMEGLMELGIIDATTYFATLSGSSWYMSMAYTNDALKSLESLYECHELLKRRCRYGLIQTMMSSSFITNYMTHRKAKRKEDRPITAVDIFGYAVGWCIFGRENIDVKLSETRYLLEKGDVPFHIISAVHVKDKLPVVTFNVSIETNPYEISAATNAVHVPTEMYNSDWSHGLVIRDLPELPLHYHIGTAGSAFAILISHLNQQSEAGDDLTNQMEQLSIKLKLDKKTAIVEEDTTDSRKSLSRGHEQEESIAETSAANLLLHRANSNSSGTTEEEDKECEEDGNDKEASWLESLLQNRGRGKVLERAAKVLNFMYRLPSVWHQEKQLKDEEPTKSGATVVRRISRKSKTLEMIDAGIACNVPAEHVLRKQRKTDVLLVLDAVVYKADGVLDHVTLMNVKRNAEKQGLKFPKFEAEEVFRDRFKELYVIEDKDENPECPIVLWFTLSNRMFKQEENYVPKHGMAATYPDGSVFNDFPEDFNTVYKTFKFQYNALTFDRLRELNRFNVLLNKQKLLDAISKKVKEKRNLNLQ